MKIELLNKIHIPHKINDITIDFINNNIILTGDKTVIIDNNHKIINLPNTLNNSLNIGHTKRYDQLFFNSSFYITCQNGSIYEYDGSTKKDIKKKLKKIIQEKNIHFILTPFSTAIKIKENKILVVDLNKNIGNIISEKEITFNTSHTIFYDNLKLNDFDFNINDKNYVIKNIFSNNSIIIKLRKTKTEKNIINIYLYNTLELIFSVAVETTHIFSKIIKDKYYAINSYGELEIWDIPTSELLDTKILDRYNYTYLDEDINQNYIYLSNSKGQFYIMDTDLNLLKKFSASNFSITKFIINNNTLYIIDSHNNLYIYKLFIN